MECNEIKEDTATKRRNIKRPKVIVNVSETRNEINKVDNNIINHKFDLNIGKCNMR